jgi:hypothetical protein
LHWIETSDFRDKPFTSKDCLQNNISLTNMNVIEYVLLQLLEQQIITINTTQNTTFKNRIVRYDYNLKSEIESKNNKNNNK